MQLLTARIAPQADLSTQVGKLEETHFDAELEERLNDITRQVEDLKLHDDTTSSPRIWTRSKCRRNSASMPT